MRKSILLFTFTFIFSFGSLAQGNENPGHICRDVNNDLNKITICHAGNDNNNPGRVNFVNICVDFASVHGHLKNHDHDSIGACGVTDLKEGIAWACNAGIKHEAPSQRACYKRSNPLERCIPTSCETGESCDCVCSGQSGGANNVDFMSYIGKDFSDYEELYNVELDNYWVGSSHQTKSSNGYQVADLDEDNFIVATHIEENFVMKDQELSFNLGSELFGTEYFVDLCWKNINFESAGKFNLNPTYSYKNKAGFGNTYVESADIYTRTEVLCIDENGDEHDIFDEEYFMFPDQMSEMTPSVGVVENMNFCKVRHYFKEFSNDFRPWELSAIDVSTNLEVTLTPDQVARDSSLILCHNITYEAEVEVEYKVRGKTYTRIETQDVDAVCQLEFENSQEYEDFVLHHDHSSTNQGNDEYSVNHNDDSRVTSGLCPGNLATVQVCLDNMNSYHTNTNLKKAQTTKALNRPVTN